MVLLFVKFIISSLVSVLDNSVLQGRPKWAFKVAILLPNWE